MSIFSFQSLFKKLKTFFYTYQCKKTGFLYQFVYCQRVYLRTKHEFLSKKELDYLCKNIYYKHYMPKNNDLVVCIGAGLGHEAIWIKSIAPNVKYIGVEIQPFVYELLCNTFKENKNFHAFSKALNNKTNKVHISSAFDYTAVNEDNNGYIEVDTFSWDKFINKYKLKKIHLLQINIEGAEKYLLPMINTYKNIDNIIISSHDFRADRGHGEHFRTRNFIKTYLESVGYTVKKCGEKSREKDWLFATFK
jgi:FkbM family methyltransferase